MKWQNSYEVTVMLFFYIFFSCLLVYHSKHIDLGHLTHLPLTIERLLLSLVLAIKPRGQSPAKEGVFLRHAHPCINKRAFPNISTIAFPSGVVHLNWTTLSSLTYHQQRKWNLHYWLRQCKLVYSWTKKIVIFHQHHVPSFL